MLNTVHANFRHIPQLQKNVIKDNKKMYFRINTKWMGKLFYHKYTKLVQPCACIAKAHNQQLNPTALVML